MFWCACRSTLNSIYFLCSLKRTGKIAKTGKGKGKGLEADAGPSLVPEIEAAEGTVAAVETVTGQTAEIDGMTGTGETGIGTGTVIGAVSVSVMIGITIGEAGGSRPCTMLPACMGAPAFTMSFIVQGSGAHTGCCPYSTRERARA